MTLVSAHRARKLILAGHAPTGMLVRGLLSLAHETTLTALPEHLEVDTLTLDGCAALRALPPGLRCRRLSLSQAPITTLPADLRVSEALVIRDCPQLASLPAALRLQQLAVSACAELRTLPPGLELGHLALSQAPIAELPPDLRVTDTLGLCDCLELRSLPAGLRLQQLALTGCRGLTALPDDLRVDELLNVSDCASLERLPDGLQLENLIAVGCHHLRALPDDLRVSGLLALSTCTALERLPRVQVGRLQLDGCTSLRELPEGLEAAFLDISGCVALEEWPRTGLRALRQLVMRNCRRLTSLPPGVTRLELLDISGCSALRTLPEELYVRGVLEVADTSLQMAPPRMQGRLRWRGVRVPDDVVLRPETITTRDILEERDTEVRRVMIERMGYERFMYESGALILDEDHDPGGPRQLLRVEFLNDEPLVCLAVFDPSTGRQYLLRVPPQMRTCRRAAAWIAGFDDPDDYQPVAET